MEPKQTDGRSVPHQTDLGNQSLWKHVEAKAAKKGGEVWRRSIRPQPLRLREGSMEGNAELEIGQRCYRWRTRKNLERLCRGPISALPYTSHCIREFREHLWETNRTRYKNRILTAIPTLARSRG